MSHVSLPARRVGAVPIGRTDSEPTIAFAEHFGGTLASGDAPMTVKSLARLNSSATRHWRLT
jgi:hypothetical protein